MRLFKKKQSEQIDFPEDVIEELKKVPKSMRKKYIKLYKDFLEGKVFDIKDHMVKK